MQVVCPQHADARKILAVINGSPGINVCLQVCRYDWMIVVVKCGGGGSDVIVKCGG